MGKAFYGAGVHKCPKCSGRAPFDKEEEVYKCITCGHEELELHSFYIRCEKNKREIIQDFLDDGPEKMMAKWQMPLVAWHRLRRKWGVHLVWTCPGFYSRSLNGYRKLPAWQQDWPVELKIKWLETYQATLGVSKK